MSKFKFFSVFFTLVFISTIFALKQYSGEFYIFIFFTITSNTLLYFGFRKNAIFFDTFIGVFLWLGFWFKTTVRIVFLDNVFSEGLADVYISSKTFDEAIFISSIAFLALIIASYLREKFIFRYADKKEEEKSGLFLFYKNYRKTVLLIYIFIFMFIALSNFYLGIYQKGGITHTVLPFGLNGVYKWLLLFGLSSFAALILKYEFSLQKKIVYFVPILTLVEACVTNISLFSRGMILNTSALGLGMIKNFELRKIKMKITFFLIITIVFLFLFFSSIILVNKLRHNDSVAITTNNISNTIVNYGAKSVVSLFLDRWVGIDGVLAVSNSSKKGWHLFKEALEEKYNEHETSFFDLNIINSPYIQTDKNKHHFISIPGFIAFFYYPGNTLFLFFVIFILGLIASIIELITYKLCDNNLILSALIAQVIAYRYTNFGYVPAQSYLLFGSIFLNLFIIYGANKILSVWYKSELQIAKS